MKAWAFVFFALIGIQSSFASGGKVRVSCEIKVGDQVVLPASTFAHQPYIMPADGKDRAGQDRHFEVGVDFDKGRFSARVIDDDHPIDQGSYITSAILGSASVALTAPNQLTLSIGDPALPDPVIQVNCELSAAKD